MNQETILEHQKLVIKRTFAAPVERVYQAWTDSAQMAQWFSPNVRWNRPLIDIEPVPGGRYDVTMRHSDGEERCMIERHRVGLHAGRPSRPGGTQMGLCRLNGSESTLIGPRRKDLPAAPQLPS